MLHSQQMFDNSQQQSPDLKWFAMYDIKRPNDPNRAYKVLTNRGFEVFTPLKTHLNKLNGRYVRVETAMFPDMLFVHTTKNLLDEQVEIIPTLWYRLKTGARQAKHDSIIIIDDASMNNFRLACASEFEKEFIKAGEIDKSLIGRKVRVFCNSVDGQFTGNLLRIKGRGVKVLVELSGLLRMKLHLTKNDLVQFIDEKKEKE